MTHTQKLREFSEWLDSYRDLPVHEVFHEIVLRYEEALAMPTEPAYAHPDTLPPKPPESVTVESSNKQPPTFIPFFQIVGNEPPKLDWSEPSQPVALPDEREAFERYFAWSRKSKGVNRRPTFEQFDDGTYKDDHTQRHWWTWQQARAAVAQGGK